MIATIQIIRDKSIASRGSYRIMADISGHPPDYRKGFRQIVRACRALHGAKADYVVNWDTPETGVLILYSIPRKAAKAKRAPVKRAMRPFTCPIECPSADKCLTEIAKLRDSVLDLYRRRRRVLMPEDLTHATIESGRQWHSNRDIQRRVGHGLAQWLAIGEQDYKALDILYGHAVRRGSQLPTFYRGNYKEYLIREAKNGGRNYDFTPHTDAMPEADWIVEQITELAYWQAMYWLTQDYAGGHNA